MLDTFHHLAHDTDLCNDLEYDWKKEYLGNPIDQIKLHKADDCIHS